jgi:hypothetical protein
MLFLFVLGGEKMKREEYCYSAQDIEYIKENFKNSTESINKIAQHLNKTFNAIQMKIFKLGLTKSRLWSDQEIKIMIKYYPYLSNVKLIKKYLPNRSKDAIVAMAQKLNLVKSEDKDNKYFNKEEMINDLRKLAEKIGRTPYQFELVENGLPSGKSFDRYFGRYSNACVEAGLTPNSLVFGKGIGMMASDGSKCASRSEYIISEYLIKNNILFIREARYKDYINDERCGDKRVDWVVKDYFIEFFGMPEKEQYKNRMQEKIAICQDHNIKLISLFRNDLKKLDKKLHVLIENIN